MKHLNTHLAYLALGSNLNHPLSQVSHGLKQLAQHSQIILIAQSPFYATFPLGSENQPAFINLIAAIQTSLSPFDLLAATQLMEKNQGRPPVHAHWSPRTLDVDILLYDNEHLHTDTLIIPHPQMHHRSFIMEPLKELIKGINSSSILTQHNEQ